MKDMNLEPEVQSSKVCRLTEVVEHLNVQCLKCALVVVKLMGNDTIPVKSRVLDSAEQIVTSRTHTDHTETALCM